MEYNSNIGIYIIWLNNRPRKNEAMRSNINFLKILKVKLHGFCMDQTQLQLKI